jgi:hypothetical protein
MALPNPNPGGQAGAAVIPFPGGGGGGAGSGGASGSAAATSVKSLVALTKDMVNIQKNILNVLNIIDTRLEQFIGDPSEKREVKDTAGGVSAKKLNWKDIMGKAGGFGNVLGAALVAYVFDLDKYIRAAFAAKVLFRPLVNGVKAAFRGIGTEFKALFNGVKAAFRGIGTAFKALFNTKAFLTAIKPFTTAFDNFMAGFKNVGKVMGAVKTPVAIKEFKTFFGKIGATIGSIVKPVISAFNTVKGVISKIFAPFKTVGSIISKVMAPIGKIFSFIGGIFSSIMTALGPVIRIAGNFLKAVPIVGQIVMVLFGIFDFISGFLKGFKEDGIIGGLKEGFKELIRGFLTKPLDLLTEGVSYLMGLLGFDSVKESIDKFLADGGFTGMFNDIMDTLGKAFDKVVQFFKDLFNDPIGTLQSVASNIGDFLMDVFKPIGDAFTKAKNWIKEKIGFGDSGGDGGKGFDISSIFGFLDFEFPSVKNIMAEVGTKLNGVFQYIAEEIAKKNIPLVGEKLSGFFADAGVKAAKMLGTPSVQKFAGVGKEMETVNLKESVGELDIGASTGAATGELSKDVAAKKEGGGGITVVSQKSGDVVTQSSSTSVAQDKSNARKSNPASGKIKN